MVMVTTDGGKNQQHLLVSVCIDNERQPDPVNVNICQRIQWGILGKNHKFLSKSVTVRQMTFFRLL